MGTRDCALEPFLIAIAQGSVESPWSRLRYGLGGKGRGQKGQGRGKGKGLEIESLVMDLQLHSIVDNKDVVGPRALGSINPATEEQIAEVSLLDAAGADEAIASALRAREGWATTTLDERRRILRKWLEIMLDEQEELAQLVSRENGKPVSEAWLVDVAPSCGTLSWWEKNLDRLLRFREARPDQLMLGHWHSGYRFDPLGVLSVITPWNYPVGIPIWELVPAIAAGNTVVFKPASATVLIGLRLGDMARRAGMPPGVMNTVALPGSASDILMDDSRISKVLFTGSVEIGRHVARRCAERLIPAQLELGGKDAAVVAADADLERTARGLVWGAFMNTGQSCASVERVYAESAIYEPLVDRIVELTQELRVGDPSEPETDIGPMTTRGQREEVERHVAQAVENGARVLCGGERPEGPGFFYPPSVLVDVSDNMEIMQEETFGPTMPIARVKDLDEGIRRANASRFGLTASGWTNSTQTANRFKRELVAGVVAINEHGLPVCGEANACWGGVGESGIGRAHGEFGLHEVVNIKYVASDAGKKVSEPWYYPYGEDLSNFLRAALPLLFGTGLKRYRGLGRLLGTRRFRERVRLSNLLRGIDKLI